jgi:hypothetical protein
LSFPVDQVLEPTYVMRSPDSPVALLKNKLKLSKNKIMCEGDGLIQLKWRPSPSISFEMECDISHIKSNELPIGPARLESGESRPLCFDVFVTEINTKGKDNRKVASISGDIAYPKTIPEKPAERSKVKFHLINFINYPGTGRLILDNSNCLIKIDKNNNADKLYKILRKKGGYAITHTGLLEHKNGTLKLEEARSQLEALYYFSAFLSGRWCGPVLSSGLSEGLRIWETLDVITNEWFAILDELDGRGNQIKKPVAGARDRLRLTPNVSGWHWNYGVDTIELNQAFQGFMKKWDEISWRDHLKTAIFLYTEANQGSGGTDGAIVLAQSALEIFASLHERNTGRSRADADIKIRRLLKDLDIPEDIPFYVKDLKIFCETKLTTERFKDGPKIITYIRNKITHPIRKDIQKDDTEDKIKLQALSLELWFVEMILLHHFDYTSRYANRLWRFGEGAFEGGSGFLQQVPWRS